MKTLSLVFTLAFISSAFGAPDSLSLLRQIPSMKHACSMKGHPYWDTGNTMQMLQGNDVYATCLEDLLLKLTKEYYPQNVYVEFKKKLPALHSDLGDLYYSLYNEIKMCTPACGSINRVNSSAEYGQFLEKAILNMAQAIESQAGVEPSSVVTPEWLKQYKGN